MKWLHDIGRGCLGVPLAEPRVALSACTPRSFVAVGYPLRSLTRKAAPRSPGYFGQKSPLDALNILGTIHPLVPRHPEGPSRCVQAHFSIPPDQAPMAATQSALSAFLSNDSLSLPGSHQCLAPLLRKGVRSFVCRDTPHAREAGRCIPLRGCSDRPRLASPLRGYAKARHLTGHSNRGQAMVKHLGTFV